MLKLEVPRLFKLEGTRRPGIGKATENLPLQLPGFGSPFAVDRQVFSVARRPNGCTAGRTCGTARGQTCTGPTASFSQFLRARRTSLPMSSSLILSNHGDPK